MSHSYKPYCAQLMTFFSQLVFHSRPEALEAAQHLLEVALDKSVSKINLMQRGLKCQI